MNSLIKDRDLFPLTVHAGISGNIVLGLILSDIPMYMIMLLAMLAPIPFKMLLFSNKYSKELKFKDEEASLKEKIWGKNLVIYFLFLIEISLLVTTSMFLQERFFKFDYQGIFTLGVNIIYFGTLFLIFLKKLSFK